MTLRKVLCVDDSKADLLNIEKIVMASNLLVVTAANGREAIEKARTERPDLIFMDVNMPGMDGFAATRELAKNPETKGIPVVMVTAKDQKADRVWAQMQGAKGYVTKPYSREDIVAQLESF